MSSANLKRALKAQRRKAGSAEEREAAEQLAESFRQRFKPQEEADAWAVLAALIEENAKDEKGVALVRLVAQTRFDELSADWHPSIAEPARQLLRHWCQTVAQRSRLSFDNPICKLFDAIAQAKAKDPRTWFVTVQDGQTLTFGSDNWIFLKAYALTQGDSASVKGVILRRRELNPSQQPPWRAMISGVAAKGKSAKTLSAQEVLESHTVDAQTGEPVDADPHCQYVATAELLPAFAFQVAPETFKGPRAVH
jgi:hypothetical protein